MADEEDGLDWLVEERREELVIPTMFTGVPLRKKKKSDETKVPHKRIFHIWDDPYYNGWV